MFFTRKPGEEEEISFRRRADISQQNRRTGTSEKKPGEELLVLSGKMDQRTGQYNISHLEKQGKIPFQARLPLTEEEFQRT